MTPPKSNPAILFIGHDASRTGAPISLLNIIRWTREHSAFTCHLILGNSGPLTDEYAKYATVYIWSAPRDHSGGHNAVASRLLSWLSQGPPTAAQRQSKVLAQVQRLPIRCIFNNTGVNGHILEAVRARTAAPVLSRIPELEAYMRKNNRNGSVDRILALTDRFVAVSEAVKANLVRRHAVPADRIDVLHGASEAVRVRRGQAGLRAKFSLPEDAFLVGACGTLDYRKGIDLFIQLAHHCVNRLGRRDIHFCWVGSPVSPNSWIEYRFEAEALGLAGHLHFAGPIEDTAPAFAELDVFALTSREDPFPLVMLEAARQGLPIVCFQGSGGAVEFVDDEVGAAVPMLDIGAFARAVLALRDAPEQRLRLGEAAHQRSLTYTPERMASAFHRVIEQLVQQHARA
jgi:glycosyltransferase involved in cell wall biosynthesis